jgi:hypothetical protein
MNNVVWISATLFLGVIAGAAGGVVATHLWEAPTTKPARTSALASDASELDELENRIAALEHGMSRQQTFSKLSQLAQNTRGRSKDSDDETDGEADDSKSKSGIDDPVFEAAVRDVLARAETERREERQARREQRSRQRAEAWSQDLTQRLSLTEEQRGKLEQLALDYYQKVRERWQARAEDGADAGVVTWQERRQQVQALRQQYDQRLGEVLDRDQMEKYEALEPESRLGSGFGRRGGRPR